MMTATMSLWLGLASVGQAAPASAHADVAPPGPSNIELIRLRHASAAEIAATTQGVLTKVELAIDERTNTLIALGRPDAIAQLRAVVARLDVAQPDDDETEESVHRVYTLRYVSPEAAVNNLRPLLNAHQTRDVSVTADVATRQILAFGPASQLSTLDHAIRDIDRPASPGGSYSIQVHCLIAGGDGEAADPDLGIPGGEDVAEELSRLGIRDASPLFKTLARVEGRSEFQISGSATRGQRVEVIGEVIESTGETVKMSLQMSLALSNGEEACTILTTVRAPFGDQVVIGAAPHEGATVVLVVRILEH